MPERGAGSPELDTLPRMFAALTQPACPDEERRAALAWFTSAWPQLSARLRALTDGANEEGLADEESLDVVRQLMPFLAAVHNWRPMADVSRLGLDAAARLGSTTDPVDLSQSLGAALQQLERDDEAEEAFRQAADRAADLGDERARAAALAHLGQLRHHRGDLPEATALLQQAALGYRSVGHETGEARRLGDLAPLLHQLGAPAEAEHYARRARQLFHDLGDHIQEARALRLVAAAEAERHADKDALRSLDDARGGRRACGRGGSAHRCPGASARRGSGGRAGRCGAGPGQGAGVRRRAGVGDRAVVHGRGGGGGGVGPAGRADRGGTPATKEALLRALPTATHLHFAGHGHYDPEEPLASHLALADGEHLTLRDLFDGQALRGVRLVVASACQTAVTDMTRLPDESVGQAGATAVIGSLWEVNDRSTALLVAGIYDFHLRGVPELGDPPMPASVALARAQAWMREGTLRNWMPSLLGSVCAGAPMPATPNTRPTGPPSSSSATAEGAPGRAARTGSRAVRGGEWGPSGHRVTRKLQ
ncbi:CHAT domain-containing protein [Streptomyces sp. NBC_00663]|uniref:CHAT domain-containing protein n=1 Tax=Streptomyces sp. NBC_00663 TaxID=2975801 RepID=UPI002E369961|nr:CHAT domain-containing tetratricopeptide repeat protein [Streptomyces sp. NBC_00663]